jgi:16S rRNA (cytidine1402-2'-O)-methyltransferase
MDPPTAGPARRGTLYVVATPIGNLNDLSPRALGVLAESRLIACEDTRITRKLLTRHGLRARLISCHKFNEAARVGPLLETLREGAVVALVSDSGTPGLSDPGALLVRSAREDGHRVVPIPGPSALTALLSASGMAAGPFTFIGFLPHRRGERRRVLASLRLEPRVLVFFEAPHRIRETLEDLLNIMGDRSACLGREMTKHHEEIRADRLGALLEHFSRVTPKGEIAFLIEGADERTLREASRADAESPPLSPVEEVRGLMRQGWDRKDALRRVARERGVSRREIYRQMVAQRGGVAVRSDEEE